MNVWAMPSVTCAGVMELLGNMTPLLFEGAPLCLVLLPTSKRPWQAT